MPRVERWPLSDQRCSVSGLLLSEAHPRTLEQFITEGRPLILPMGTIEWHSHHLPLGLDGLKAESIARAAAERCDGVVAPTAWWAVGGVPFPYTLNLPAEIIQPVFTEVFVQYASFGFRTLVAVYGHYGVDNAIAVRRAAVDCMKRTRTTVLPIADYEVLVEVGARGDHAGIWETSLLWASRPDLIDLEALEPDRDLPGVAGDDPRGHASPELGAQAVEAAAERIAATVVDVGRCNGERRSRLLIALEAGLEALEALQNMRRSLPRADVPRVPTASWLAYLEAFLDGRYDEAVHHAARKRHDPAS